jgi:hypothetical protein
LANGGGNPYPRYTVTTGNNTISTHPQLFDNYHTGTTINPYPSSIDHHRAPHPLDHPVGPVKGLDDMCAILNVEPSGMVMGELILMSDSGKLFRFFDILQAQVGMMASLHMLLVHEGK